MSGSQQQDTPFEILDFQGFTGLNTNASRTGIKDTELSICDGFMPVGDNKLRTIPDIGNAIFSAPLGQTVSFFDFANIGKTPYMVVICSDGSIWLVNTATLVSVEVAPPTTIITPLRTLAGTTQWGSAAIIVVAQQPNGYFVLDGSVFYQPGTVAPFNADQLISGGAAYTSMPGYIVFGGAGSGVTLTPVITQGSITSFIITNPGSGYLPGDIVQVGFSGGGSDQTPILEAVISTGVVAFLTLVAGGSSYTDGVFALAFSGGGGSGATGTFTVAGGIITAIALTTGGSGYTGAPTVSFAASSGGSGGVAIAALTPGAVTAVTVVHGGTNLIGTPLLTIEGGGGSGAVAIATVSGGVITSVKVTAGGSGYTSDPAVIVQAGLNNAAYVTLDTIPFGISGSAAETYQSRVWVTNPYSTSPQGAGGTVNFSGPGTYTDFSTSAGGGSFTSNDSFLRVAYVQPKQTNGFLYLIGDSSVNYIGGVSTTGSPPETTFTNQNADPEIGTPYPATVDVIGSNIVFANAFGAQVSYGGRVNKISEPLDGIYNTVGNSFDGFQLSAAKAILYGKRVWALLIPIIDQVTGLQVNKLCMWSPEEKRWWTTNQSVSLTYCQHQEIASILTAYGTDGINIYPLFQTPSVTFTKTAQSKLWSKPGGLTGAKASNRVWLAAEYFADGNPDIIVAADNETETGSPTATFVPTLATPPVGFYVAPPTALSQTGTLLGMTISTNAADMALALAAMDAVPAGYRG